MAFNPYHNISGSDGIEAELLAPGDGANDVKSILITNTYTTDIIVSLFIQNNPSTAIAPSTFYMLKNVAIADGTSLLLDSNDMLSFDNGTNGFGLYIQVGSSDTADVFITR